MYASYHIALVRDSCGPCLTPYAMDLVIGANFNCDFLGTIGWKILEKRVYPLFPFAWLTYRREVHLDGEGGFDGLAAAWHRRQDLTLRYLDAGRAPRPHPVRILRALGHVTHAAADFYTHANYVECLFDYYRGAGAPDSRLAARVAEEGPLFSDFASGGDAGHPELKNILVKDLFSDVSIPDTGPRSHAEINKDFPGAKRCNDPRWPEMFRTTFALARRETNKTVNGFMDALRAGRAEVFEALRAFGADRPFTAPGPGERRAKRLVDLVGTWE